MPCFQRIYKTLYMWLVVADSILHVMDIQLKDIMQFTSIVIFRVDKEGCDWQDRQSVQAQARSGQTKRTKGKWPVWARLDTHLL